MTMHRLQSDLELADMTSSGRAVYVKDLHGHLFAWGDGFPTAGSTGYAPGCMFHNTSASTPEDAVRVNIGDADACDFQAISTGSDYGATGLSTDVVHESTAGAGVTVDGVLNKDGAVTASGLSDFSGGIKSDTVAEHTAAAGVTVDGTLIKDGQVQGSAPLKADTIAEYSAASGVTCDGVLNKDGGVTASALSDFAAGIKADTIAEHTAAAGVTIDSTLIKDGQLQGASPLKADTIAEFNANTGVTIDGLKIKDGQIDMVALGATAIVLQDNLASAFRFLENANPIIAINTTNSAESINANYRVSFRSTASPAAAGSTQGDATAITAMVNRVTAADGTKGVVMPTGGALGDLYILYNDSASVLKVWPGSSQQINNTAVNTNVTLAARNMAILVNIGTNASGNPGYFAIGGTL